MRRLSAAAAGGLARFVCREQKVSFDRRKIANVREKTGSVKRGHIRWERSRACVKGSRGPVKGSHLIEQWSRVSTKGSPKSVCGSRMSAEGAQMFRETIARWVCAFGLANAQGELSPFLIRRSGSVQLSYLLFCVIR